MADYGSNSATLEKLRTGLKDLGSKVRTSSVAAGKTLSEQVTVVSGKVKDLFVTPTIADKYVDEATSEVLYEPDWGRNLQICDLVNVDKLSSVDVVRGIKRRLGVKNSRVQILSLLLLEAAAKNCVRVFSDVSQEKVLDDMVRISDDPLADREVRDKVLKMIEAWGEATDELRYLPVFEETYKSLKSRGIHFPGRDNESLAPIFTPPQSHPIAPRGPQTLTEPVSVQLNETDDPKEIIAVARNTSELLSTVLTSAPPKEALKDELVPSLVSQLAHSQLAVQRIVQSGSSEEAVLFEALSVNDQIVAVLEKYDALQKEVGSVGVETEAPKPESPAVVPVSVNAEEDDEEETEGLLRKSRKTNEDLIKF